MSESFNLSRVNALAAGLVGRPVTVEFVSHCDDPDPDAVGLAIHSRNTVQVKSSESLESQTKTLVHELFHLANHKPPCTKSRREKEEEANDFAYQYARSFKRKHGFSLVEYLAGYWSVIAPNAVESYTGDRAEKAHGSATLGSEVITFGSEVKALPGGKLSGYLVRFTDADHSDLQNDFFTKDTDFDIEEGDTTGIYYNHGLDPTLKKRKLGIGTLEIQPAGVWVETQLAMRDDYERAIYALAKDGKLGWSSGTLPNLVEREQVGKAYWIKSWPLGKDASLTPTPAAGIGLTDAIVKAFAGGIDLAREVKAYRIEQDHTELRMKRRINSGYRRFTKRY